MKEIRNKIQVLGLFVLILSTGVLGYDNYKRAEEIVELKTAVKSANYYIYSYALRYAICKKKLEQSN